MKIECPNCSQRIEVPSDFPARTAPCPGCGTILVLRPRASPSPVLRKYVPKQANRSIFAILLGFSGRIRRRSYWVITLGSFAGYMILVWLIAVSVTAEPSINPERPELPTHIYGIIFVATILYFWVNISCNVQRWHDRGKSGFWILIGAIPIVGWVWALLETGFLPGAPGRNPFGPPPGHIQ